MKKCENEGAIMTFSVNFDLPYFFSKFHLRIFLGLCVTEGPKRLLKGRFTP